MSDDERLDAGDAVRLARECFDRIASALEETIRKAEQLGDTCMLDRLTKAKVAADRGSELVASLFDRIDAKQHGDSDSAD